MKICLISEAKSIHTQRWAGGLAKSGCDIHLVSSSKAYIPGIKIHYQPIYDRNPIQQVINNSRIKRLFAMLRPDIFHLFGLFSVFSLGTMILINNLNNLVVSLWGSDVVAASDVESYKDLYIKKYLLNKADHLIAVSEYLKQETKKYLYNPKEIEVVPWGINSSHFYPKVRHNNQKVIKLGFAKKLHKLSGPDVALKAFKYACERFNNKLLLRIAGDGPMISHLKNEAAKMGIADHIEWIGWLASTKSLREFYQSIDVFLMPSRRESYGVAALEAGASGLPVVASNFGGIPEIVIHGETGLLVTSENWVEFGEAILTLAKNQELRIKMGRNARLRAENEFNWDFSLSKMVKIYNQLIKSG
jgi:glycosyltransferase involved in cell wall biosynthesis